MKKRFKGLTQLVASAALLTLANSAFAANYFSLDGVVKNTEIASWNWGMSRSVGDPLTGGATGRPAFDRVNISRLADNNSVRFLVSFLKANNSRRGSITTVADDGFTESRLEFDDVVITSITTAANKSTATTQPTIDPITGEPVAKTQPSSTNTENVSFTMSRFTLTIYNRNGTIERAGYDLASARPI